MSCLYDVPLNFEQMLQFHTHTRIIKISTKETMIKYSKHSNIFRMFLYYYFVCLLLNGKDARIKFIFSILSQINDIFDAKKAKDDSESYTKNRSFDRAINNEWILFLILHIRGHCQSYAVISL